MHHLQDLPFFVKNLKQIVPRLILLGALQEVHPTANCNYYPQGVHKLASKGISAVYVVNW